MKQKTLVLLIFIGVSSFCLFCMSCKNSLAAQNQLNFEKDKIYDIYYQVENHTQYITEVKIIDTVTIGTTAFLEIEPLHLRAEDNGYISVSSIIAILPTGSPRPQIN